MGKKSQNVILTGFMGTGKSVVGRRLARRFGWPFIDIDKRIEANADMSIANIFVKRGEAVFRRLERLHVSQAMRGHHQVIGTGGGAFVDSLSRRRLLASGTVICLTARPRVILARVGRRLAARPMLSGATDPLASIRTLLTQRAKAYAQADLTMDTSDLPVEEIVEQLWQQISPCVCKSWQYLLDHSKELSQRYAGQYVAVIEDRVVASGETQLEAYQKIPRRQAKKEEAGIYYLPLPQESLTAF